MNSLQIIKLRNDIVLSALGYEQCRYRSRPAVETTFVQPSLFGQAHEVFDCKSTRNKIYLGPQSAASSEALGALHNAGIAGICNCTARGPKFHAGVLKYCQVNVHDNGAADILRYLEGAALFINSMLQKGSVLVHCEYGVSRSSTVVLAYLMRYHGMTRDEAYVLIKRRRPKINPNQGFWNQLATYEQTTQEMKRNPTPLMSGENYAMKMEYRPWIEMTQALYATCHEVEGVLASHLCWQLLNTVRASQETLHSFLYACLDFIWGRGLRDVDLEWFDYVLHSFSTEPKTHVRKQLRSHIEDPKSEFREAWSGEIRQPQIDKLEKAVLEGK